MLAQKRPFYSAETYLQLEEQADHKSEYFAGEIFAMAGGSFNHDMIAGNVYAAFHRFARTRSCFAFTSNMKLLVQANGLYTYPDAMLLCGQPQFVPGRTDTVTNPNVLVEVLSKSTENYDRGKKFELYRDIPTFKEYLLIAQDRAYIEYFHKVDLGGWLFTSVHDLDASLTLTSLNLTLAISDLYEQVDWRS